MAYNPDFESLKPDFFEKLPYYLKRTEAFLKGKKWFAGDNITICDFLMWDVLEALTLMESTALDSYPLLKDFLVQFETCSPELEAYMKSSEFIHWPLAGTVSSALININSILYILSD